MQMLHVFNFIVKTKVGGRKTEGILNFIVKYQRKIHLYVFIYEGPSELKVKIDFKKVYK